MESGGLSGIFVLRSAEFLGESDEKPFRPADVAEPIRVFILDYFAYELRAALAEPFKRLVDVVHDPCLMSRLLSNESVISPRWGFVIVSRRADPSLLGEHRRGIR